ncbi:MAG: family 16 glycosylhydrolase, partial [Clostridia bacterium]|nr:family 16 glycosylhydrolase [Clostridia bacterium]
NNDGVVNADDATYLLFSILVGEEYYPMPYVNVTFNNNGKVNTYEMLPGSQLNSLGSIYLDDFTSYEFDGWYDSTFTTEYTTVPDTDITLYAKYDRYTAYSFDQGGFYDPNDKQHISAVEDPFGGEGKVLYTPVINFNDKINYGFYRGFVPSVYDGVSNVGFAFEKNHTYRVYFDYRFDDSDPSDAACYVQGYAVDPAGVYKDGNKTTITISGKTTLMKSASWKTACVEVTNTSDYKHLFLRMLGSSSSVVYNLYLDNFVICDITPVDGIKLVNGGVTEVSSLSVGDTLPVLSAIYDNISSVSFEFDGWYDKTLTTKYTTVDSSVDTYYAKYNSYAKLSFESNGIYDPNGKYSATSSGIPCWWRAWDPVTPGNVVLRADISKAGGNNTHVPISAVEGADSGFVLTAGKKYAITFDYYLSSKKVDAAEVAVRGSAQANLGASGGKTDVLGRTELYETNQWSSGGIYFEADDTVKDCPNLIFMSQGSVGSDVILYFDNVVIREFDADSDVKIYQPTEKITYNDNGVVTIVNDSYIGGEFINEVGYYGAEFDGWYNSTLTVPYSSVPKDNAKLYAKYDGAVITFENGGYYNPNNNFNKSAFSIVEDPTDSSNTVIKANLVGNIANNNFGLPVSGYSNEGYKLTVGNTYEISFMYYAENLNSSGVSVQFRGCKQGNIGTINGKSSAYGHKSLKTEKSWTGVTATFKYNGTDLEGVDEQYLIMMVQDGANGAGAEACTATIYFDDIVIKEVEGAKTYTAKTTKIGGYTLGYTGRTVNIVVPSNAFSYLAMMQCEELAATIKGITTRSVTANIVYENKWRDLGSNSQFCIFVGDVVGCSSDNKYKIDTSDFTEDDYAYSFGSGNIYVDGGSTYALAMGISELRKELEAAADGYEFPIGTIVSGKYSEKIDSYSTASYYRPTFLEDFDQDDIDTTVWNEMDGMTISSSVEGKMSKRSAEHTYLENGNLVIKAAFDDKMYYGGMLRSHGKMEYRYGYLETSCITPHGAGLWTSLWTTVNGRAEGLFGAEVDVNECFGDARYSAFNMHTWPTGAGSNLGNVHYSLDNRYSNAKKADAGSGKTFATDFHTFGYFWTKDCGKFTVDGKVYFEYNFDPSSSYYVDDIDTFNDKLSLIISMTVANPSAGGQVPDESADYWNTTNKYIVDYIHIYQIDGQEIYYYQK